MLNKNMLRRLNDLKIKQFFILGVQTESNGYEDFATLLLFRDKTADLFYDYSSAIQGALEKRDLEKVKGIVQDAATKFSVYELLSLWKKIVAQRPVGTLLFNLCNRLMTLLLELKVGHTICGFNEDTGEVFIDERYPTAYEMPMCFDVPKNIGIGFKDKKTGKVFEITDSEKQKFLAFLKIKYGENVIEEAKLKALRITPIEKSLMTEECYLKLSKEIFKRFIIVVFTTTACQIFNNDYFPQSSIDCCTWTPEFTKENDNPVMSSFLFLLEILGSKKFLYKRNRLVREDGVIIRFNEMYDGFNQILVKEVHDCNGHYLLVVGQTDCGLQRTLVLNLEDVSKTAGALMYEVDVSLFMCLFEWLGLREELRKAVEVTEPTEFLSKVPDSKLEKATEDAFEIVKDGLIDFIDVICSAAREFLNNAEYLKPMHWNYTGTTKFNKKVRNGMGEYCELRKVGAHVRKLSRGHASSDAVAAAERYCIELKPGYTLVSEYVRKQHVREN